MMLDTDEAVMDTPLAVTADAPPRRRGRPPGSRNRPKDVLPPTYDAPDIGEVAALPTKRRARSAGSGTRQKLTPQQIADVAKMAHELAAAQLGPKARITDAEAQALGEAIVPVLEDFGIRVASRVVHLVVLMTTVAMVEGPVVIGLASEMREQARTARAQARASASPTMRPNTEPPVTNGRATSFDDIVARAQGVERGAPNIEAL